METFISNSTYVLHITTNNKEAQKLKSEENLLVANQIQHLFDEKVIIIIIFPFTSLRENLFVADQIHEVMNYINYVCNISVFLANSYWI